MNNNRLFYVRFPARCTAEVFPFSKTPYIGVLGKRKTSTCTRRARVGY